MSIWEFSALVSDRLMTWSAFSTIVGVFMMIRRQPFWRGLGSQFIGWGVIDALIAVIGTQGTNERRARMNSHTAAVRIREAGNLRTLLWVNMFLDVLYMIAGWQLAKPKPSDRGMLSRLLPNQPPAFVRGIGIGIIVQGAFLFVFDLVHAQSVPDQTR